MATVSNDGATGGGDDDSLGSSRRYPRVQGSMNGLVMYDSWTNVVESSVVETQSARTRGEGGDVRSPRWGGWRQTISHGWLASRKDRRPDEMSLQTCCGSQGPVAWRGVRRGRRAGARSGEASRPTRGMLVGRTVPGFQTSHHESRQALEVWQQCWPAARCSDGPGDASMETREVWQRCCAVADSARLADASSSRSERTGSVQAIYGPARHWHWH